MSRTAVGAPGDGGEDVTEWTAQIRADGMRAAMDRMAAAEPQPPPGWLLDNLSETDAEMFAQLVEAWAAEPGSWPDFPRIRARTLIICGEHEEPHADRHARQAARTIPRGAVAVLPGLHHLQAFWRTDETLPPLLSFLGSVQRDEAAEARGLPGLGV